ncbi:hypothetical protein CKA32_004192 [Geitlerinema sp. FC II]|nr:hypothetical protein CKA32_004192 [Geitlerinema sp. FC II]
MHFKNVNLSDRGLRSKLSCCWVSRSLHPTYSKFMFLQK